MNTLYISDLDGTLLAPDARLSDTSLSLLTELTAQGVLFTVATARTPFSVTPILRRLIPTVPGVLMNGVLLYDFAEKKILRAEKIPAASAELLFTLLREKGVTGFGYTLENGEIQTWYENLTSSYRHAFYQERVDRYRKPFYHIDTFGELASRQLIYLSMMEPQSVLDPVAEGLAAIPGISFAYYKDIYNPDIWYLEVFSEQASKYHAVNRLREYCQEHFTVNRIIGFGDNLNDLPLFRACDAAYAVANAREEVKKQADGILGANTEDAVARFIKGQFGTAGKF